MPARELAALKRGTARILAEHPSHAPARARAPGLWRIAQAAYAGPGDPFAPYLGLRSRPPGGRRQTVPLPGGEVGYTMEPGRPDGCLAPCIATILQTPVEEVPDPRVDERRASAPAAVPDDLIVELAWTILDAWLADRGLQAVVHYDEPVHLERWIAVCVPPAIEVVHPTNGSRIRGRDVFLYLDAARDTVATDDAETARLVAEATTAVRFGLHALVMCRDRVYHDPAIGLDPPPGQTHCPYEIDDVAYGITIEERK
jgi:hypothetical protein